MDDDPFADRLGRFRHRLGDSDVAILSPGENMYYLSGFSGERDRDVLLSIPADGDPTFVSSAAYAGQVSDGSWIRNVVSVPRNRPADVVDGLADLVGRVDGRVLLDDSMPAKYAQRLERALSGATFGLAGELLGPMRARKDDVERRALRRAAERTDAVSEEIRAMGADAIGMTERELAVEIRTRLHAKGAERLAFPVVVAAGENGARPTQYRHGDREIRAGDPVVLDFGGFFDHYPSDQTRTVVFGGDPPDGFVDAHECVREALEAGVEAAEPGLTASELDRVVRGVIEDAGYGERFVTGTGHGVGLRAHEPPSIGPDSDATLDAGSVFSVEPGIYFEGEYGVRLETLVELDDDGAEALNTSPYAWEPSRHVG